MGGPIDGVPDSADAPDDEPETEWHGVVRGGGSDARDTRNPFADFVETHKRIPVDEADDLDGETDADTLRQSADILAAVEVDSGLPSLDGERSRPRPTAFGPPSRASSITRTAKSAPMLRTPLITVSSLKRS